MISVDLFESIYNFDPLYYRVGFNNIDICFQVLLQELSASDPYGLLGSVQSARHRLNTSLHSFDKRVRVKRYLLEFAAIFCLYHYDEVVGYLSHTYVAELDPSYVWQKELLAALGRDPEKENFEGTFCGVVE
jgi:hypothetical protein